ncbi:MAG: acyl carrier protein [Bacteroidetes bacterium]|nr:acyl carrier protein [Bacteroidota bacterium]
MPNTIEKLQLIINQLLDSNSKENISSLQASSNLRDEIGLDSFDLAGLTVRIKWEFGVDVFDSVIVSTVGEIVKK